MEKIKFKALCDNFELPEYETEGAANFDLRVHFNSFLKGDPVRTIIYAKSDFNSTKEKCLNNDPIDEIPLDPGDRALIPLGFSIELPSDKKLEIYSRSGLAIKNGIVILNQPGQIDSDYRGCVCAIIKNEGNLRFIIHEGDRICQGAIVDVVKSEFELVEDLSETKRADGGFGHSGIN